MCDIVYIYGAYVPVAAYVHTLFEVAQHPIAVSKML